MEGIFNIIVVIIGLGILFALWMLFSYLQDRVYDLQDFIESKFSKLKESRLKRKKKIKITPSDLSPIYNIRALEPKQYTLTFNNESYSISKEKKVIQVNDQLLIQPLSKKKSRGLRPIDCSYYVCTMDGKVIGIIDDNNLCCEIKKGNRWEVFVKEIKEPNNDILIELWEYTDLDTLQVYEEAIINCFISVFQKSKGIYIPYDNLQWTERRDPTYRWAQVYESGKAVNETIFDQYQKYGFESKEDFYNYLKNIKNVKSITLEFWNIKHSQSEMNLIRSQGVRHDPPTREASIEFRFSTQSLYDISFQHKEKWAHYYYYNIDLFDVESSYINYLRFVRTSEIIKAIREKDEIPFTPWEQKEKEPPTSIKIEPDFE